MILYTDEQEHLEAIARLELHRPGYYNKFAFAFQAETEEERTLLARAHDKMFGSRLSKCHMLPEIPPELSSATYYNTTYPYGEGGHHGPFMWIIYLSENIMNKYEEIMPKFIDDYIKAAGLYDCVTNSAQVKQLSLFEMEA